MGPVYYSIMKNKLKEITIKMIKDMIYITIANFKPYYSYLVSLKFLPLYTVITFFTTILNEVLIFHNFSGALIMWYISLISVVSCMCLLIWNILNENAYLDRHFLRINFNTISYNPWTLYTISALFTSTPCLVLSIHNFTGALIILYISLISIVCFMYLGFKHEAIYQNDHTVWKIYINIYVIAIICKDLVVNTIEGLINLMRLFVIGASVVIYELFNNTFIVKPQGYIFSRYYKSIYDEDTLKSVMVFCTAFYFIIRLGINIEDYYVFMNSLESSGNGGASSSGGGNGNPNPNHKPSDYSKFGSTSISTNQGDENSESVSQYRGKDTLTSNSFRWQDCVNTWINLAYPLEPIYGPGEAKPVISPFIHMLPAGSDSVSGRVPQESNFIMANLSYRTDVSGKGHYIVARGGNVHINSLQRGELYTCDIEKIKISADFNKGEKEVLALNLKKCNFTYTEWRGRQGVFIPPIFTEHDIILNRNGSQVPRFTSGVFIEGRDLRFKKPK